MSGQSIESTFNHPFYVQGKGWTFVKDLKVGDLLVQSDGNTLKIDSIELLHKQVTVYNMTVDEFHTYFVSELGIWVHNTNSGINNVRVMQDTKIKGYTVSMDVERGGSGLVNVHVKVNNTKYFYDAETSQFLDGTGNRLPNSLRGNEQINNALKKAQKYVKSWCFNINMTKEKNNKKSKYQEIKYIKYNQDDILEILTEALAKENGFGTFYSKAMLLGTLGKDLRLIAVIGELEDDEKIELINLNELDENMNYNGTHK